VLGHGPGDTCRARRFSVLLMRELFLSCIPDLEPNGVHRRLCVHRRLVDAMRTIVPLPRGLKDAHDEDVFAIVSTISSAPAFLLLRCCQGPATALRTWTSPRSRAGKGLLRAARHALKTATNLFGVRNCYDGKCRSSSGGQPPLPVQRLRSSDDMSSCVPLISGHHGWPSTWVILCCSPH
jgi:hypothetical protein